MRFRELGKSYDIHGETYQVVESPSRDFSCKGCDLFKKYCENVPVEILGCVDGNTPVRFKRVEKENKVPVERFEIQQVTEDKELILDLTIPWIYLKLKTPRLSQTVNEFLKSKTGEDSVFQTVPKDVYPDILNRDGSKYFFDFRIDNPDGFHILVYKWMFNENFAVKSCL